MSVGNVRDSVQAAVQALLGSQIGSHIGYLSSQDQVMACLLSHSQHAAALVPPVGMSMAHAPVGSLSTVPTRCAGCDLYSTLKEQSDAVQYLPVLDLVRAAHEGAHNHAPVLPAASSLQPHGFIPSDFSSLPADEADMLAFTVPVPKPEPTRMEDMSVGQLVTQLRRRARQDETHSADTTHAGGVTANAASPTREQEEFGFDEYLSRLAQVEEAIRLQTKPKHVSRPLAVGEPSTRRQLAIDKQRERDKEMRERDKDQHKDADAHTGHVPTAAYPQSWSEAIQRRMQST
jgi:hypothetical protein